MSKIDTIVVPLDGSSVAARSLPVVKRLVEAHGATVVLVTSTWNGQGATDAQLLDAAEALPGVEVRTVVVEDRTPPEAAADVVLAGDHRVLCMSSHGRGGLRRAVLGSVTADVIRTGAVPVLVIGPSCDPASFEHPGPIELCVDGSQRSVAVVTTGVQWGASLGRDIHLVLVSNPMDPLTGVESAGTFADLLAPVGLAASDEIGTCAYNASVPLGLVSEAKRLKSPLMVIAPAVRSRFGRLVLGSTTLSVLNHAPCPVLVLPKDNSPVEAP